MFTRQGPLQAVFPGSDAAFLDSAEGPSEVDLSKLHLRLGCDKSFRPEATFWWG